ncbi:MAG: hypothetical protein NDJ92_10195, partial [Thermoanaerobaculia bacterium]|nr:hypothetical protein [Thermoanaerobaculia bacterium]
PTNIGSFLNDLPARNRVVLRTADGATFPGRTVRLYRPSSGKDSDWRQHPYQLDFDAIPDAEFVADAQGGIDVGRNPFSDGPLVIYVDQANVVAILEIDDAGTRRHGYLESRSLNLAYWRGETESAEHVVIVDPPPCAVGIGPDKVEPRHEAVVSGPYVQFTWPAEANRVYEVWVSVDGARAVSVHRMTSARDQIAKTRQSVSGRRVAWWLTEGAPGSGCPPRRSAIYYFDLDGVKWERRRPVRP